MVVSSVVIMLLIFCTSWCTKSHDKSKLVEKMKRNPATIHSLAALSLITNVYIICLDIIAVIYWTRHGESELRDLFHKIEMERTLGPLVFVFIVDAAMLIWGTFFLLLTIVFMCKYDKKNCESQCTCENRFSVSSRGTCHCKACVPNVNGSRSFYVDVNFSS